MDDPKNQTKDEEKDLSRWMMGGIFGVALLLLIVVLFQPHSSEHFALHYDDTWEDLGATEGRIFFRKDKVLTAYDAQGMAWEKEMGNLICVAYGKNLYVLEEDGTLHVLRPSDGKEISTEHLEGMRNLRVMPAGAFQEEQVLGCYPDHFTRLDEKGHPIETIRTVGSPGLFAGNGKIWTWSEEKTLSASSIHSEGSLSEDPNMPALTQASSSEEGALVVESQMSGKAESIDFRTPLPATIRQLAFTGERSVIAGDDLHFYFVVDGNLRASVPHDADWGFCVTTQEIWAYSKETLLQFHPDGSLESSQSLRFVPKSIVSTEDGVVVIGEQERLEMRNDGTQSVETGKFLRTLVQPDGSSFLLYEEEVVPLF